MRVVAVLDLMRGAVVRGIAGERHTYRPIESRLTRDTSPAEVAQAICDALPIRDFYLADLDAIAGAEPAFAAYESVASLGVRLWVDAGAGDASRARQLAEFQTGDRALERVVVGLESLGDAASLHETHEAIGAARAVFSLDLKSGRPLSRIAAWRDADAVDIARAAVEAGFGRMIVLDLARVGTGQGIAVTALCRTLRARYDGLELISGGGVRHLDDLRELADAGCNAALVASALHDGRLSAADIEAAAGFH
jgi:phosphoribosylformimino-5-aminoimidazole carboxamide ribotide isomerase